MGLFVSRLLQQVAVAASMVVLVLVLGAQTVSAVDLFGGACTGPGSSSNICGANGQDNISGPDGVILKAANLISIIGGIAAVIMIMIAGFFFVTSGGDSNRTQTARKTLTYAVVGLVVIALARTIVVFFVVRV